MFQNQWLLNVFEILGFLCHYTDFYHIIPRSSVDFEGVVMIASRKFNVFLFLNPALNSNILNEEKQFKSRTLFYHVMAADQPISPESGLKTVTENALRKVNQN